MGHCTGLAATTALSGRAENRLEVGVHVILTKASAKRWSECRVFFRFFPPEPHDATARCRPRSVRRMGRDIQRRTILGRGEFAALPSRDPSLYPAALLSPNSACWSIRTA